MAKLTRDLYIPCLDTSATKDLSGFVPIDKSTIFELAWNPETETYTYICNRSNSTEVTSFALSMEQEIVLDNSNPMYAFMYPLCFSMPTGSDAVVPFLLVDPDMTTGQPTRGKLWKDATIQPSTLNTVDGKLAFTINLNGDMVEGDVTITTDAQGRKQFTFEEDQ